MSAILRIATVLAAIVLLAMGEGLWDAPTGNAAVGEQRENFALAKPQASTGVALPLKASLDEMKAPASDPLPALSSVLLVAQDESPGAPPQPSAGAKTSSPPESQEENPAPVAPASPPHPRAASRSALNEHLSSDLSQYLHQNHLPFVDALVFGNASGHPTSVKLSGQVRTEHGKEGAEIKSRDFINKPGLLIENHVEVNASLAFESDRGSRRARWSVGTPPVRRLPRPTLLPTCVSRTRVIAIALARLKLLAAPQVEVSQSKRFWASLDSRRPQLKQCNEIMCTDPRALYVSMQPGRRFRTAIRRHRPTA